MVIDVLH
jgi:hypothetical protein